MRKRIITALVLGALAAGCEQRSLPSAQKSVVSEWKACLKHSPELLALTAAQTGETPSDEEVRRAQDQWERRGCETTQRALIAQAKAMAGNATKQLPEGETAAKEALALLERAERFSECWKFSEDQAALDAFPDLPTEAQLDEARAEREKRDCDKHAAAVTQSARQAAVVLRSAGR